MDDLYRNYCLIDDLGSTIKVCIIVPTYNESLNITTLLDRIYSAKSIKGYEDRHVIMNVLVVDDNSPDQTYKIVENYQKKNLNVHLLVRQQKQGLGAAYIHGMRHAMQSLAPHIIFEMDADLSHNPRYILPMIDKIRAGADFVIGSRYIKGGSIPENWGFYRRMVSKSANVYTKLLLRPKVNDCTGGFRAIRTSVLKNIDLELLDVKGYVFQMALLNQMMLHGSIITEVPIAFEDRTNGDSKMRAKDIFEVGTVIMRLAFNNTMTQLSGARPRLLDQRRQLEPYLIKI